MCDNMDEDIPPLAYRVEDLEDDYDHEENFIILVGDRENDATCEHNKIIENGGNDETSENDMMNAIAFLSVDAPFALARSLPNSNSRICGGEPGLGL